MRNGFKKFAGLFCSLLFTALTVFSQNTDTRVFEMRTYYSPDGKLDDLVKRFKKHTLKLFEKHGMENLGYWLPVQNDSNKLVYVLAYPNLAARNASWKAFSEDPVWRKVQTQSEANGRLVLKVVSQFLKATEFSPPIITANKKGRLFQLRTYTCEPGKLDDLLARFRNHTLALFEKHGAENITYWTTIEKDGKQPTLIYILAFSRQPAADKMWTEFRQDPEWIKVKEASEKNGPITSKVEGFYMRALPFSKMK